jgi:hypothetical protein
MNDQSKFNMAGAAPAGLWQRAATVPMKGREGQPGLRFRAELQPQKAPKKRAFGPLWRRGPKCGDIAVVHAVDKWDRMIWVRPDALTLEITGKGGKRRRIRLAGRNMVAEPVRAAWITRQHDGDEAHRFGSAWTVARHAQSTSQPPWHRTPVPGRG